MDLRKPRVHTVRRGDELLQLHWENGGNETLTQQHFYLDGSCQLSSVTALRYCASAVNII